eukprot:TRINITY_DN14919_c0_g1_i1.p1 TRINITY_DN14919_c0_g1~~TRINITY_DN14919_c0_g1_i1.p1  ORF type:complete len:327 (+),score=31.77 TRINITY_DN14919_c0_g1_i1:53-982(+)
MSEPEHMDNNLCTGRVLLLGPVRELVFDCLGWQSLVLLYTWKAIHELCKDRIPRALLKSEGNRISLLDDSSSLRDCLRAAKLLFDKSTNLLRDLDRPAHEFKPGNPYKPGEMLDVLDSVHRWYDAIVLDTRGTGPDTEILVHYKSWSNKWDEWIHVTNDAERIAPLYSKLFGPSGDRSWSKHRDSQIWWVWIPSSLPILTDPTAGFAAILTRLGTPNPTRRWNNDFTVSILVEFFESYLVKPEILRNKSRDRCIFRSEICPLGLSADGVKLADRYLVHVHDDCHSVVIMRRIGPDPCLGFPAQQVWNRP